MDGANSTDSVWSTTGERFDVSTERIFIPKTVQDFFETDDIFCLVASKGMGKTVLLKYKHYLVQRDNQRPGMLVVPTSQEVDYVSLPRNLSRDWLNNLRTRADWNDIWQISIILSLFLNHPERYNAGTHQEWVKEISSFKFLHRDLARKIDARINEGKLFRDTPSGVLGYLLSMQSVSHYLNFKDEVIPNLTRFYVDSFRSGAYVFIDSFDQSLAEVGAFGGDSEIWASGQIGLAKASWQINRQNPHIKVFTSMRQEAYAKFTDEDRLAMLGSMLTIRLEQKDLRNMFDQLVQNYEKKSNLEGFTGLSSVRNKMADKEESVFDYIYRHVLGKPRELAVLGGEIRSARLNQISEENQRQSRLRSVVNETAAAEINKSYLQGEMVRFLDDLKSPTHLDQFFRLIPHTVLTHDEMDRVRKRFAKSVYGSADIDCHPFCELYNIGLLGYISRDYDGNEIQRFSYPYEFEGAQKRLIPASRFYFLHPSLHNHISLRSDAKNCLKDILVGDRLPWSDSFDQSLKEQELRIFISYSYQNRKFVDRFERTLLEKFDDLSIRVYTWRDVWRMRTGQLVQDQMHEAIRDTDIMIAILSKQAVEAGHMKTEWQHMIHRELTEKQGIRLLPVAKDDVDVNHFSNLITRHVKRLPNPQAAAFGKVVQSLCQDALEAQIELKHQPSPGL